MKKKHIVIYLIVLFFKLSIAQDTLLINQEIVSEYRIENSQLILSNTFFEMPNHFEMDEIQNDFNIKKYSLTNEYFDGMIRINNNNISGYISNNIYTYRLTESSNNRLTIIKTSNNINSRITENNDLDFNKLQKKIKNKHIKDSLEQVNNIGFNNLRVTVSPVGCFTRVLVAYTNAALIDRTSGGTNMSDYIQDLIDDANAIYLRSNVNVRLKLAAAVLFNYDENKSNRDIKDNLDDFMADNNIVTQRELFKADICHLLVQNNNDKDIAGYANTIYADNKDEAFCVTDVDYALNGSFHTFTHELGHLQGCGHNREDACFLGICGTYESYSFGYRFTNGSLKYRTMMGVASGDYKNSVRIPYFSNPNLSPAESGSVPIGESNKNNSRSLNETFNHMSSLNDNYYDINVTNLSIPNHQFGNFSVSHNANLGSNVTVSNGGKLAVFAGNRIRLTNGFRSANGSEFRASVNNFSDCGNSNGRMENGEGFLNDHSDTTIIKKSDIRITKKYSHLKTTIFPNPTTSKVHLTTGFDGESEIVLTDIAGKTLQTFTTTSNETDIDLSAYSNGVLVVS